MLSGLREVLLEVVDLLLEARLKPIFLGRVDVTILRTELDTIGVSVRIEENVLVFGSF